MRTLAAAGAAVVAFVVLGFALQDLLSYLRTVSEGAAYWTWASSSQGIWQLTEGLAEAFAAFGLMLLTVRLLSASPLWKPRSA